MNTNKKTEKEKTNTTPNNTIKMDLENVEILGFKATIVNVQETLKKVEEIRNNCCDTGIIQLMNADAIAGKKHLEHGIIHGSNAFNRNENLAKDLGIEILLRTSGQRQISKAFKILGLKEGEMNIAIVLIDCPDYFIDELSHMFIRDDSVLESDELKLKRIYEIPEKELNKIHIEDVLIDKTTKLIIDK